MIKKIFLGVSMASGVRIIQPAFLSVLMSTRACRVDKVLSSATARMAAEALSAPQKALLFEVVAEELALAFALGVIKTL